MMLNLANVYYFSPTGGTEKIALAFANAIAEKVQVDAMKGESPLEPADLTVVAAPVFGGRIPSVFTDHLNTLSGNGQKAVVLAVYGNRAYEDALLELKDTVCSRGFQVIAAGAFIAQHSIAPEIGANRPDEQDLETIRGFAAQVLAKMDSAECVGDIPGSTPYQDGMTVPFAPVTSEDCIGCCLCANNCPTQAIAMEEGRSKADPAKCILCMRCTSLCPVGAIDLLPPVRQAMSAKLSPFTARKEPELFL